MTVWAPLDVNVAEYAMATVGSSSAINSLFPCRGRVCCFIANIRVLVLRILELLPDAHGTPAPIGRSVMAICGYVAGGEDVTIASRDEKDVRIRRQQLGVP